MLEMFETIISVVWVLSITAQVFLIDSRLSKIEEKLNDQ